MIGSSTGPTTESAPPGRNVTRIAGGSDAPERARRCLLTQLDGDLSEQQTTDAALIVSELVTNSVVHAHVGPGQDLLLDTARVGDHLCIAVVDPGSELQPQIRPLDPTVSGGFGLRLVERMTSAWGVRQAANASTRVWCELRL